MSQPFLVDVSTYYPVFLFFITAIIISLAIIILSRLLSNARPYKDKLSAYECGFEGIGDARGKFDIKFYLIAILFIIFDLEIAFLFPWAISLAKIGMYGFWSMISFITILTIGFAYEWRKGALD